MKFISHGCQPVVRGLFVKFSGSFRSQFNDKPKGDRVLRGETPTPAG